MACENSGEDGYVVAEIGVLLVGIIHFSPGDPARGKKGLEFGVIGMRFFAYVIRGLEH